MSMTARTTGILSDRGIAALFDSGRLISERALDHDQVQPASLDLRLGVKAYRVRASFMPGPTSLVADKLDRLKLHVIDLSEGAVLETGCVYIVPLMERLDLPAHMSASANPKSSTGRLDIFTRVITDYAQEFDKIPAGYSGPLYLEISPRTFPIVVRRGSRLSQIRFRIGNALLGEPELLALHEAETLVASKQPNVSGGGIALSIDLTGDAEGLIGYRGKHHTAVVDVALQPRPQRTDPRSGRVLYSRVTRGCACSAPLRRRDDPFRPAGRRIPRTLCGLLRSGLRPRGNGRTRKPRCAGGPQSRGPLHP
jgi:dCTP deaminase